MIDEKTVTMPMSEYNRLSSYAEDFKKLCKTEKDKDDSVLLTLYGFFDDEFIKTEGLGWRLTTPSLLFLNREEVIAQLKATILKKQEEYGLLLIEKNMEITNLQHALMKNRANVNEISLFDRLFRWEKVKKQISSLRGFKND